MYTKVVLGIWKNSAPKTNLLLCFLVPPVSADFDLCFKNRPLLSQSSANWRCRAEAVRAEAQGVDRILLSKTRFGSLMPECMNPSRTRTSESGAKSSSTNNENYIACFWYSPYSLTSTTAPRAVKSSSANKVFPCCSISPPRRTPLTSEGALSQALADGSAALREALRLGELPIDLLAAIAKL